MTLPATPAQQDLAAFNRRLKDLGEPPRFWDLNRREAIWNGKRYEVERRPSWWDPMIPLRERAPCVVDPIAKRAGRRLINLVAGHGKFPGITCGPKAHDVAIAEDHRKVVATFASAIAKAAKLKTTWPQIIEAGLKVGTVCVVCVIREGLPVADIIPAKWCTPTLDASGKVTQLDVRYRRAGKNGRHIWYRRLITTTSDTVFAEVEADEEGREPEWIPAQSFAIPFCYVLWRRNMRDPGDNDVDGRWLFDGLDDEIEALDFSVSQRHRNAQYNGEPQMVQTGVSPGGPSIAGNVGQTSLNTESQFEKDRGIVGKFFSWFGDPSKQGGPALKKAPGQVWKLPPGSDAKFLESTGAGAQILNGDVGDLRQMIHDAVGVVVADMNVLGANATAAFLLQLMEPMLAVGDYLRELYGNDLLVAIIDMFMRLILAESAKGTVFVDGIDEVLPTLQTLYKVDATGTQRWLGVPLELTWGAYVQPTWADRQQAIATAKAGNGEQPVLTLEQSVEMVASAVGIDDVPAHMLTLTGQAASAHGQVQEMLGTLAPKAAAPSPDPLAVDPKAALDGAQVKSLQEIITSVAMRQLPRSSGVAMLVAAFPIDETMADKIMGEVGVTFFSAPPPEHEAALAAASDELGATKRSLSSTKAMLDRVLAKNAAGEIVVGSPIGPNGEDVTDAELTDLAAKAEGAPAPAPTT